MTRNTAKLDHDLAQLEADMQQYRTNDNGWKHDADAWGSEVQTWMGDADAFGQQQLGWNAEVDAWGQHAERRFAFFGTRVRDLQEQNNQLRRQIVGLRQLTTTSSVWSLFIGIIAGVASGVIIAANSDQTNWWAAGLGLALGVIAFIVVDFIVNHRNRRIVALGAQHPTNQQNQTQAQPASPANANANAPTQVMPATPANPATNQQPQAQPAVANP